MSSSVENFAIGIDIGATKIASVILSAAGEPVDTSQMLTLPDEGMKAVFDKVADQILDLAGQKPGAVVGVGIGSPGKVDSSRGIVYDAVNLGWKEANLIEEISNRIGPSLPVWIQKDTNLNALGEYYFGACQNCTDFVYIGVGSGLGAGIISNGHLITGGDWYAADIGHLSINPDGPLCVCGGRGCAELVASGPGLVRVTQGMLANFSARSILSDHLRELTPADVLDAAEKGDPLALQALTEVGRVLGIVMSACTAILNPSRFVIGGGLGLAGFDFVVPTIREEMMRRTIPNHRSQMDIVQSQVESPAIGAACLVWYSLSGKIMKKAVR
ncbi:MAG TPA: ROK family protein [Anaerolineales bacterium]|nr:ROK family protein [Anaerolineales bacterium]